jgi:hypothetical protein
MYRYFLYKCFGLDRCLVLLAFSADVWSSRLHAARTKQCVDEEILLHRFLSILYTCAQEQVFLKALTRDAQYRLFRKLYHTRNHMSWDSSVSKVSDYRLDDWGSISGRGKGFVPGSVCRPALRPTQWVPGVLSRG